MTREVFSGAFAYAPYGTAALRIALGLVFVWFAYQKLFPERRERIAFFEKLSLRPAVAFYAAVTTLEGLAGLGLTLGYFTQLAALVTGTLMTIATYVKLKRPAALPFNTTEFYVLLVVVSVALFLNGGGAWALDAAR